MQFSLPPFVARQISAIITDDTRMHAVLCVFLCMQFLSRPFVVGDRVELSSAGGERVLVGVIERVDPMRTIIRTDASLPVTIPNKVLAAYLSTSPAASATMCPYIRM